MNFTCRFGAENTTNFTQWHRIAVQKPEFSFVYERLNYYYSSKFALCFGGIFFVDDWLFGSGNTNWRSLPKSTNSWPHLRYLKTFIFYTGLLFLGPSAALITWPYVSFTYLAMELKVKKKKNWTDISVKWKETDTNKLITWTITLVNC